MHPIDAYARAIVAGRLPAGKYHRLACVRHERDRDREDTRRFPYRLELERADRFTRFAAQLKHYKGKWAGQPIALRPWQQFRLGSLFGWIDTRTGLRRIRTHYNEIPRKNGKSLEASIVALYATFFDGEPGSEGYCIATKRDQARIVWGDSRQLVRASSLKHRLTTQIANIHHDASSSKLEPLGADKDGTDGLNPHVIITDELHAFKERALLDVMESATGAREQPIHFQITTAGDDAISVCGDQHDYACKILDRVFDDETFFAFIAHADLEDDWTLEKTWKKANPNYAVSVNPADLRALARKAERMPAAAAEFQQKRCNLWVNAAAPWLSIDGWRAGQSRTWAPADMHGRRCWIGIDLSSKIDLTAVVCVFPPELERASWRLVAYCLTPADTLEERAKRDRAPYGVWVAQGYLHTNPGNRIDQRVVLERVLEAARDYDVQAIGLDPWNAGNLPAELEAESLPVVEVPQNMQQMSDPSKEFEADVLDGLVDAGDNPLVLWCASNAVVNRDNKDNIYPTKRRSRGRIDPIVATLIGRKLAAMLEDDLAADDPDLIVA